MGKIPNNKKNKRRNRHIVNPIGLNTVDIVEEEKEIKVADALPILDKLNSNDSNERAWAAAGISNLIQSSETQKYLLKNNLLGKLLNGLNDTVNEVIIEVAGAIRNLINNDNSICTELYNRNILNQITALLPRVNELISGAITMSQNNNKDTKKTEYDIKIAYDFAEQVIQIIWCMSESSEKFTKSIITLNIIPFLMEFLKSMDKLPMNLVNVAAQCLNTLTEENEDVYVYFRNTPEYFTILKAIAAGQVDVVNKWENNGILLRALASNILYNIRNILVFSMNELYSIIFNTISYCLEYNTSNSIKEMTLLAEKLKIEEQQIVQKTKDMKNETIVNLTKGRPSNDKVKELESQLTTIQLAFEILANVCSEDFKEDEREIEEEEMEMDDENADDESFLEDMAKVTEVDHNSNDQSNDERVKYIINLGLIHKVIVYSETTYEYSEDIQNYASSFIDNTTLIQLRSINALNNIIMMMPNEWFISNITDARNMWAWLYNLAIKFSEMSIKKDSNKNINDLIEAVVNCMWSLVRAVDGLNTEHLKIVPTEEQVRSLIATYNNSAVSDNLRVRCVGVLGLFCKLQGNIPLNKTIGDFLIELPSTCNNMEIVCEVLNAIYDAYGDKIYDYDEPVFVKGGYLNKLKQCYPVVQRKTKNVDRRKMRDLREHADEALYNLRAFIQYKLSEYRKN